MAKPASGQMVPRTSQYSGRLPLADTSVAEVIRTSSPKALAASAPHLMAGPAARRTASAERMSARQINFTDKILSRNRRQWLMKMSFLRKGYRGLTDERKPSARPEWES